MPELPEVETIRQNLLPRVLHQEIQRVEVLYPRVLPKNELAQFVADLQQLQFLDIQRRGKYLLFALSSGLQMVVHLRMTGRLLAYHQITPPVKHTSMVLTFEHGRQLHFQDQRKFGTVYLLAQDELSIIHGLKTMGPEPLSDTFTPGLLEQQIQSTRSIKSILLDQKRIAGLGNIYATECLFRSRIHPERPGMSLQPDEVASLHEAIRQVLADALAYEGTTIRNYQTGQGTQGAFQNQLNVYGKQGQPCPDCSTAIACIRIGGRSSHFCPTCQRRDAS